MSSLIQKLPPVNITVTSQDGPVTMQSFGFRIGRVLRMKPSGDVSCNSLRAIICDLLALSFGPRDTSHKNKRDAEFSHELAARKLPWTRWWDFAAARNSKEAANRVAAFLGHSKAELWPSKYGVALARAAKPAPALTTAIASAAAFRLAIDALPVGRDIRARLTAHLDRHIADLAAIG